MSSTSFPKKFLGSDRTNKILISILVITIVFIVGLIILSVLISYLRKEVSLPILSFNVGIHSLWTMNSSICDPYHIQSGSYRMNFFNSENIFVHTIFIYEIMLSTKINTNININETKNDKKELLHTLIVPQNSSINQYDYSIVLNHPGHFVFENYANNTKIGSITFIYPNPCITSSI